MGQDQSSEAAEPKPLALGLVDDSGIEGCLNGIQVCNVSRGDASDAGSIGSCQSSRLQNGPGDASDAGSIVSIGSRVQVPGHWVELPVPQSNLLARVPPGSAWSIVMGERLLQGPGIYLTLGLATQFAKRDLDDAVEDFRNNHDDEMSNIRSEVIEDGFVFMADNITAVGTTYWTLGLRAVGKITVQIQCVGASRFQQENAVPFFKSLRKQEKV